MRDAVIVEAVRTPVGRRNGGLSGVHPADLSAHVLNSLVDRAGLGPALVDAIGADLAGRLLGPGHGEKRRAARAQG